MTDFVGRAARPATVASLAADLRALGVTEGSTLLVHSSLSALGFVCGGAPAVVQALRSALGAGGTLTVPTHSGDLSEPSRWRNPPVPQDWWQTIRDETPPFDPATTPTWQRPYHHVPGPRARGSRRRGAHGSSRARVPGCRDVSAASLAHALT